MANARSRPTHAWAWWIAVLAACLCGQATHAAPAGWLPDDVAAQLHRHRIPRSDVSLFVQRVDASHPLLTLNDHVARNPASVIKLLTSLAALDLLGPDYTWRTEAHLDGTLRRGRLDGDLILKGYGDPFLTPEDFWRLLHDLRGRGLTRIAGDVVLDEDYFEPPPGARGDFDGRPLRAYNALPAALSLNFQATRIHLLPEHGARRVRVYTDPPLTNLKVSNRIRLVDAPCRRRHHRPKLSIEDSGSAATLRLGGTYSSRCDEASYARLLLSPADHVAGTFQALWKEMGGEMNGRVRTGSLPPGTSVLHTARSRPLGEVVRAINKWSNNVMTRALFLTLGAERLGAPGTRAKGRLAVKGWLEDQGLLFPELALDNGAGLSRDTRIAARSLGRLLIHAYRGPHMPEFMASLAIPGVDGTLRARLRGESVAGHAHLKTGSLDDVSALAGYVLDAEGRRWVTVVLIGHPRLQAWQAWTVQDALVRWVHAGAHAPPSERVVDCKATPCPAERVSSASVATEPGS